jgi:hypothetical protein
MPSARNTFIFRAKRREGDEGDLRIFIVEGLTDIWLASKSHRIMAPGDIVFFWMAGKPEIRGIYGWGILISVAEKDFEDGSLSVSVRYERRFASASPCWQQPRNATRACVSCQSFGTQLVQTFLCRPCWPGISRSRWVSSGSDAPDTLLEGRQFPFDVGLSFAGEDRGYARKLEELL